jgi:hypothetical protein
VLELGSLGGGAVGFHQAAREGAARREEKGQRDGWKRGEAARGGGGSQVREGEEEEEGCVLGRTGFT